MRGLGVEHVFDLADVEGTMVGFRFPDYSEGIEVSGYHLHFITADRTRGGHVLACHPTSAVAMTGPASTSSSGTKWTITPVRCKPKR